jgi:hypothetical protein
VGAAEKFGWERRRLAQCRILFAESTLQNALFERKWQDFSSWERRRPGGSAKRPHLGKSRTIRCRRDAGVPRKKTRYQVRRSPTWYTPAKNMQHWASRRLFCSVAKITIYRNDLQSQTQSPYA